MKSLEKSVKSKGIVAFAYNTEQTDYRAIAEQTLAQASRVLGIPYTVISDDYLAEFRNTRYSIDTNEFVEWRNVGRNAAYELSPYDETLVIDVDYVVLEPGLLEIFKQEWDYILLRNSHALTQEYPRYMGNNSLPFVWATVFAFRKTARSKQFFDLVSRIQHNYEYYKALFNVHGGSYRNDYAFAMADIILNGYTVSNTGIPGSMLTVDQPVNTIEVQENRLVIKDDSRAYVVPKTNLHIMSKRYLQSDNFREFIKNVSA
jgi:hypothetical protein